MDCNCSDRKSLVIKQVPGMTYVPWQYWGNIYEPCKALARGTLFEVLDKPFLGGCK